MRETKKNRKFKQFIAMLLSVLLMFYFAILLISLEASDANISKFFIDHFFLNAFILTALVPNLVLVGYYMRNDDAEYTYFKSARLMHEKEEKITNFIKLAQLITKSDAEEIVQKFITDFKKKEGINEQEPCAEEKN